MDANLTRFHLLLGRRDWAPSAAEKDDKIYSLPDSELEWDDRRHELRLRAEPFHFKASPRDNPPTQDDRRGAAVDPFFNWFWIAESRTEIRVRSSSESAPAHFWSADDARPIPCPGPAIFQPAEPPPMPCAQLFRGLTVTEDHYLIVGTLDPGGLLVFDLLGGGAPQAICWPAGIPFAPFDMVPRRGGGVWILDLDPEGARFWGLDRNLRVLPLDGSAIILAAEKEEIFQPQEGERPRQAARIFPAPILLSHASPILAENPVAIEATSDGSVLILDAPEKVKSRVLRFAPAQPHTELPYLEPAAPTQLDFAAYDLAFAAGQLFIASATGNQAFAFEWGEKVSETNEYFPMRRFEGKALVAAGEQVFYDFGERWLPLVAQSHPQHAPSATFETRIFDGHEPECVWHRLMLDACLPPGTDVEVSSRVAEDEDAVRFATWETEPRLLRRNDGSELPFTPQVASPDRGTFELLLQKARGRFLQLRLRLRGDGRLSPRLNALRLYYPRFSYLERYLPAVYRENSESASFLDRFLANFEGFNTALEDRIAAVQMLFDVRSAPADVLEWLATWFGVVLDPAWDETRRRLFLDHAMEFFQWRGTVRGLKTALRLAFEEQADAHIFDPPGAKCRCGDRFRIIEKFLTRQTPPVELGDPSTLPTGPQLVSESGKWKPADGADALHARYRKFTGDAEGFSLAPLPNADAEAARLVFAQRELGFIPSDPSEEAAAWEQEQRRELPPPVTPAPLPNDQFTEAPLAKLWRAYQTLSAPQPFGQQRRMWQRFLERRYISVLKLRRAHGTHWESFNVVAYPKELPANSMQLHDWVEFEAHVLPTLAAAHRFSVLLPVKRISATNREVLARQLALATRIVELEKPAHTSFDVKFFWAHFRVGEARLGNDSVLGLGGRDPALFPAPAILGQSYLAESLIATGPPPSLPGRTVIGRDRLPRQCPITS